MWRDEVEGEVCGGMGRRERYMEGWGGGRSMQRDGKEGEVCGGMERRDRYLDEGEAHKLMHIQSPPNCLSVI